MRKPFFKSDDPIRLEMLPVPPELTPKVWKAARKVAFSKIPGYDIERTHTRLLVGIDRLWVAYSNRPGSRSLLGVVITSLSQRPPSKRKCFRRTDPALMKSLTIHVAGEYFLLSWLDSAIERINRYAREQGCRQLFILSRKGWQRHVKRWWSREWEGVAFGRDRPTKSTCKQYRERNKPGYFRPMAPVPREKFSRHRYRIVGTFYFPLEAA